MSPLKSAKSYISVFTSLAAEAAELYNKNIMVDKKFINVY